MKYIIKKILIFIYKFFIKLNFFYGSAFILFILSKKPSINKKYKILVLSKPIFNEDVKAVEQISKKISFIYFPRLLLHEYIKKYTNINKLNDSTYYPIIEGKDSQKYIYNDMSKLFKILHKLLNFDAIFSGNYVYISQQEFCKVAEKHNIPTIILYKEGIGASIKSDREILKKMYSTKRFNASKILFYNESIQNMLLDAHIPGLTKAKTAVVGIPRFDKYFKQSHNKFNKKNILLFSFDSQLKADRFVKDESRKKKYIKRGEEFQINLVKFCIENPEYNLTVKVKTSKKSHADFLKIINKFNVSKIPQNIKIINNGSSFSLINKNYFIASFLSTTLIEGVLLGKPIICPNMNDIVNNNKFDFFFNFPSLVNYVKNYNDIKSIFNKSVGLNISLKKEKEIFLIPMLYKLDGMSAERVNKKIMELL